MSLWQTISKHISTTTGEDFDISQQQGVGGGCINDALKITDGKRHYFVKINHVSHGDMFEAEAQGLYELAASHTVRVPEPVCYGDDGSQCYLVLEYLQMSGSANMAQFAQQFAAMHRITEKQFGWFRNNTIGSTPQINTQHHDWVSFWRDNRLGYQLKLAADKGYGGELQSLGEKLMADLPSLFNYYQPLASMMHGDLWGGNLAALADGTPVIYDPAFYYGDREADLAMTQLFGGFGRRFYDAYNEAWPLDDGYSVRKTFYNLYHIINHLNMFGGAYHGQAISMTEQVLAEIS
ncbi:MAG: fructosamine kinase family protein [Gammaproteobacteria bacterium]|nr:fructosamine kinase family protein [Gammaproteobacteria bacterium]MCW8911403.1 fructosamine kinase family protein [Gammaproteobacteria bacterium]MCW9004853.1 fructosamine kinase family protein [Gammaproteobacteria bacterium]MCW9057046.1 fructosamine kinase family protein [Gammaproteobacteria bacterium]